MERGKTPAPEAAPTAAGTERDGEIAGHGQELPLGLDPERLRRAEAAVEAMAESYLEWVEKDIAQMWAASERAARDANARARELAKVGDIAHDVKGQGASFGSPLISRLGESLCRFLEVADRPGERDIAVVKAHLAAMEGVVRPAA